jgi:hypothetical protein
VADQLSVADITSVRDEIIDAEMAGVDNTNTRADENEQAIQDMT